MSDPKHPTNSNWELFDPEIHPPPNNGESLLVINEGGVLKVSPWYKGALAWGYKPIIPKTVKDKLYGRKQET